MPPRKMSHANPYMQFCAEYRASAEWSENRYARLSVPRQGEVLGAMYRNHMGTGKASARKAGKPVARQPTYGKAIKSIINNNGQSITNLKFENVYNVLKNAAAENSTISLAYSTISLAYSAKRGYPSEFVITMVEEPMQDNMFFVFATDKKDKSRNSDVIMLFMERETYDTSNKNGFTWYPIHVYMKKPRDKEDIDGQSKMEKLLHSDKLLGRYHAFLQRHNNRLIEETEAAKSQSNIQKSTPGWSTAARMMNRTAAQMNRTAAHMRRADPTAHRRGQIACAADLLDVV